MKLESLICGDEKMSEDCRNGLRNFHSITDGIVSYRPKFLKGIWGHFDPSGAPGLSVFEERSGILL
jgi:hypothetical protein